MTTLSIDQGTSATKALVVAADLTALTGLPLDPYFAAPKMTWLRRRGGRAGVITTTDSWLLHRLTGAYVTDVTTASRTSLMDLARREWSEIEQGTRRLARHRLARAVPNRSHRISGEWMTQVDPEGGPVHVRVDAT